MFLRSTTIVGLHNFQKNLAGAAQEPLGARVEDYTRRTFAEREFELSVLRKVEFHEFQKDMQSKSGTREALKATERFLNGTTISKFRIHVFTEDREPEPGISSRGTEAHKNQKEQFRQRSNTTVQ